MGRENFLTGIKFLLAAAFGLVFTLADVEAVAADGLRLKDVARFEGVRDNQLIGYGLVVGLAGTGDRLNNAPFTERSLVGMLERLGVAIDDERLLTRNVAAVMVTASMPGFTREGEKLDVTVSALGDARSLLGGTLLATPLTGADGHVYAVAQGSLIISGYEAGGQAASVSKGVPTAGKIPNGGTVEREIAFPLNELDLVRLSLNNPDFSTAQKVVESIEERFGEGAAKALDLATVEIVAPDAYRGNTTKLLAELEKLRVSADTPARVVVDERSGTIVIGENVRISQVAVTQGNITIQVSETPLASQPAPFSENGQTVVLPRTNVTVDDGGTSEFRVIDAPVSLQELVNGLNALGVAPRDVIAILQSIHSAGALHAELVVE